MVELQILSKVLNDKSLSILANNGITEEYFVAYPEEYAFVVQHRLEYGNVPDKETFLEKFPGFTILEVNESEDYLIDSFQEEFLYYQTVPVINKLAEIIQTDARAAVEFLQSKLPMLTQQTTTGGVDIIATAKKRFEEWEKRKIDPELFKIPTGFMELDEVIGGWQCGEELGIIFARTGQGKSWILIKTLEHAWKMKKRVGLIEPEMSDIKTGYRFDTLHAKISNRQLLRGEDIEKYEDYINELSHNDNPFYVASPKDFGRNITVSKLRSFIETHEIDILGIDGISYLKDERRAKNDNRTTELTHISEDLMELSIETGIPIIVVAQSNREGEKDDDAPGLGNIRDSDGIAFNASFVLAVRQVGEGIELSVRKNRNGVTGRKLMYAWDIDTGAFSFMPTTGDSPKSDFKVKRSAKAYPDGEEVF